MKVETIGLFETDCILTRFKKSATNISESLLHQNCKNFKTEFFKSKRDCSLVSLLIANFKPLSGAAVAVEHSSFLSALSRANSWWHCSHRFAFFFHAIQLIVWLRSGSWLICAFSKRIFLPYFIFFRNSRKNLLFFYWKFLSDCYWWRSKNSPENCLKNLRRKRRKSRDKFAQQTHVTSQFLAPSVARALSRLFLPSDFRFVVGTF